MKNQKPKVSILMNSYNSSKFLKQALESVKSQTYPNWEVVFIDNHSTDGSREYAEIFDERVKVYKTPKFCPLGEARNFGLTKVDGDYLCFLDTDDYWVPNKLEVQIQQLKSNIALIYSPVRLIDETGKYLSSTRVNAKPTISTLIERYDINMQTVMINIGVVGRNNLKFDCNLSYNPDFKLFLTIALNFNIQSISKPLAHYRLVSMSLSNALKDKQYSENLYVLDYLINECKNDHFELKSKIERAKVFYQKKDELSKLIQNGETRRLRHLAFCLMKYNFNYVILYISSFLPRSLLDLVLKTLSSKGFIR